MENLDGKCVALGVTGGIAAYKMANVASGLRKAGADVHVIMTENATQFITPLTFETLTNNRCVVDTFARDDAYFAGKSGGSDYDCPGYRQCDCKNGTRHCR